MEKLQVSNFPDALRIAFAAGLGSESAWLESHPPETQRKDAGSEKKASQA